MRLTRGSRGEKRGGNDEGNKAYRNCQIRARYRRNFASLSREEEADAVALPVVLAQTKPAVLSSVLWRQSTYRYFISRLHNRRV